VYPVSRTIRMASLAISALVLVSALVGAGLALMAPWISAQGHPSWALASFEGITVAAAAIGVLFGLGRYGEAPGLALVCVAGTMFGAAVLGWAGSAKAFLGHSLTPYLLARALAAACLGLLGAASVLSRDPRSWRMAVTGALLCAPATLIAAGVMTGPGQRLMAVALGSSPLQRSAVIVFGGLAVGGMLAAGGHILIRAFELGRAGETPVTSSRPA
jgi:hypothetical protein